MHREIAYAVQGQLHSLPERRKKFLTLSGREVCENAWYSIHGVSRAAYHKYKAAALAGRVNEMHGNSGITRLRPHTIQAEANFATIIQENADCMPNEFRNIGRKNTYVLADLMKAFMDSQKTTAFIPELVQEVADFKKFLHGYQHDGANKLIGLGEMHLFKFYVEEKGDDMGWPVIRYKVRSQILCIFICLFIEWK